MFYERYLELCEKTGERPYSLVLKLGAKSNSIVGQWKKGSSPRPEMLKKIADFFSVSVSYLMGLEENEKPALLTESELIPGYSDLSEENKAKTREYIALLLGAQQND